MVVCLERGADLHMTQLMPLPLTVSCYSKIQISFTFLVPAHPGRPSPRKRAVLEAGPADYMTFCFCFLFTFDNSCHAGQAALAKPVFEELRHRPYSPDLAPIDLKKCLRGLRFSTDDELKYALEEWPNKQSELSILQASKDSEIAINYAIT